VGKEHKRKSKKVALREKAAGVGRRVVGGKEAMEIKEKQEKRTQTGMTITVSVQLGEKGKTWKALCCKNHPKGWGIN